MNDNTLYTTQETTKILRKYNVLAYSTKNTSNGRTYLEVNKGMSIFKLFILDLLFVIIDPSLRKSLTFGSTLRRRGER